jgi:hypothetical protein
MAGRKMRMNWGTREKSETKLLKEDPMYPTYEWNMRNSTQFNVEQVEEAEGLRQGL